MKKVIVFVLIDTQLFLSGSSFFRSLYLWAAMTRTSTMNRGKVPRLDTCQWHLGCLEGKTHVRPSNVPHLVGNWMVRVPSWKLRCATASHLCIFWPLFFKSPGKEELFRPKELHTIKTFTSACSSILVLYVTMVRLWLDFLHRLQLLPYLLWQVV